MSDEKHATEHGNLVAALQQLAADVAALRHRVRLLESGVRLSLVPPHPEPPPVNHSPSKLSGFFTQRKKNPPG